MEVGANLKKSQGWVSVYRELIKKPIWLNSTPEQKTIFIVLLLMANHEEKEWEWRGQKYRIKPGQMITSLNSIVLNCGKGMTTQKVRTALKRFEKLGFLTNESTNKNRLITIVNWGKYQGVLKQYNNGYNMQLTSNQQAPNKHLTTNNNDNNDVIMINNDDKANYLSQINLLVRNKVTSSSIENFIGLYGIKSLKSLIEEIQKSDYLKENINFNSLNPGFVDKAIHGRYRTYRTNDFMEKEEGENPYGKVPPFELN